MPTPAPAQAWLAAFERGDYTLAAALLHPLVVENLAFTHDDDPGPSRYLALLYAEGRGVQRDPVLACALAQHSRMAGELSSPKYPKDIEAYTRLTADAERFVDQQCTPLSDDDRLLASQSIGCFGFGMGERAVEVGPYRLVISRRGLSVAGSRSAPFEELRCAALMAGARAHRVPPPADRLPGVGPRYLVDVLTWHIDTRDDRRHSRYALQWHLIEVSAAGIGFGATEQLGGLPAWPQPALRPELDVAVSFEMTRTGHVRWRIEGDPPRRGVLLREEPTP